MAAISFPAELYGAADWAALRPEVISSGQVKQDYLDARDRVLAQLHRSYYRISEVYGLSEQTGCWINGASLPDLAQAVGTIYLTLDYFAACLPLPGRLESLGKKNEAVFLDYFCRRGMENLQANTDALLRALAISCLIPDAWFPEKELVGQIKKEIRRSGVYHHIEVDLNLRLPQGGLRWMSRVTAEAVDEIREKLAEGHPWPVRLVCDPNHLESNRQVIAYACQEQKGGKLRLEIFEPGRAAAEHALLVVTRGKRVKVTEIVGEGRSLPVLGLLCDAYSPEPVPEELIPWWLRWEAVRRVWIQALGWMQKKRLPKLF